MIQDINSKKFNNEYKNITAQKDDVLFVFKGNNRNDGEVLTKNNIDEITFPTVKDFKDSKVRYLFSIDEMKFFLKLDNITDEQTQNLKEYSFNPIKILRTQSNSCMPFAAVTAFHLYMWYSENKFCGKCASPLEHDKNQRALVCPNCKNMIFPQISPAVIIGLRNNDSLLMSSYANRPYKGRALLAGFCEIGETPEETVIRETMEEVGLKVKNITYYGSQPWGFDSNLLLGFFADVDGLVDIKLDKDELARAEFIKRDEIEKDTNLFSLTATMIEEFRTGRW